MSLLDRIFVGVRRCLGRLLLMVCGFAFGGIAMMIARAPELEPWHRYRAPGELEADGTVPISLEEYQRLEDVLFAKVEEDLSQAPNSEGGISRFRAENPNCSWRFGVDDNRTFILEPEVVRGAALLLHGLSDSPHSMRALAEVLVAEGYVVVALRLPGHGTTPSGLLWVDLEDWQVAVRVAARSLVERLGADLPLLIAGYSNGAALALDYSLDSLVDETLPRADRMIFLSPALAVTELAAAAGVVARLGRIPGLTKLGWESLIAEFDPYKYNSFTFNAAAQIHRLIAGVEEGLTELHARGERESLPPILAFQSLADATVPVVSSLERLTRAMENNESRLVVFDTNSNSRFESILVPEIRALRMSLLEPRVSAFDATLIGNQDPQSQKLVARTRRAGSTSVEIERLDLRWPQGVYSLSHVALPFHPDDPVYGDGVVAKGILPLGSLELRGERGMILVPPELFQRLRYNPFFSYLEEVVLDFASLT